ncbi:MAG: EAL domain-containing protein [Eubacteriales bacterium]
MEKTDINAEVQAILASGVAPIELYRDSVLRFISDKPFAYRTRLEINSLDLGILTHNEYSVTAERTKRALLLASRALTYVNRVMDEDMERGLEYDWISVRLPDAILSKTSLDKTLDKIFGKDEKKIGKLCLEFSPHLLYNPSPKAVETLDLVRKRGVKIMLDGFGDEYCPTMKLQDYPLDYVIMHEKMLSMLKDEKRADSAGALISYLHSMRIEVLAPVLTDEADIGMCGRAGCMGYVLANSSERLLKEVANGRDRPQ